MVSQACILRTKLWVSNILRILKARLSVTLIGSPSGTATTIKVMASMMVLRRYLAKSTHSNGTPLSKTRYINSLNTRISPAIT